MTTSDNNQASNHQPPVEPPPGYVYTSALVELAQPWSSIYRHLVGSDSPYQNPGRSVLSFAIVGLDKVMVRLPNELLADVNELEDLYQGLVNDRGQRSLRAWLNDWLMHCEDVAAENEGNPNLMGVMLQKINDAYLAINTLDIMINGTRLARHKVSHVLQHLVEQLEAVSKPRVTFHQFKAHAALAHVDFKETDEQAS